MTKKEFIEKNIRKIYRFLCLEGYDLGYTDDEIDEYYETNKGFIFVGTPEEVEEEFEDGDYFIVAQDDTWMAVKALYGIGSYEGTEYGVS